MSNEIELISFDDMDLLSDKLYRYDETGFLAIPFANTQKDVWDYAIKKISKLPAFVEFLQSLKPVEMFEATMSASARELYEKGELVLRAAKKGDGLIPVLSDLNGKFVEQVRLNAKQMTPDLISSLNNLAVQQQLGEVIERLETINENLYCIEQGQRDDRIALSFSAKRKFIEALALENEDVKKVALFEAASTANNARFQLMESMKSDIKQILVAKNAQKRNRLLENIRYSFSHINLATGIASASYNALEEYRAMAVTLKGYQSFITQTLLVYDKNTDQKVFELLHSWDNQSDGMWLDQPLHLEEKISTLIDTTKSKLLCAEQGGNNEEHSADM